MKRTIAVAAAAMMMGSSGGTVILSDDFNTSQGSTFTTSGAIGTSGWNATRSGDDWGARIDGGILELTNTASEAGNANGWIFANQQLAAAGFFNPTLLNSGGLVTWAFNMRQIRSDPAGFQSNTYGVGFVLGASSAALATSGSGYAVVLGNTSTPDPLRLVAYTGGIQSLGTATGGIITAAAPLNDPTTSHMSIMVTYDPATNEWAMYGRNDGTSFADPLSGTLTLLGTAADSTHTGTSLPYMGAYWQGVTAANQTAFFDNVTLMAIPEPGTLALLLGAGGTLALLRRRRRG